ncbi:metallophosphoesterase family protein [Liquorilactobacillus mali]|uniref:Phosphohydrolase, Icc family protein n=1 Tax=Liquorilactobacillus mali KCTC 3596 = DSM 20444 TaxID=1046596 RepID=J0L007_9LACO|nr:metallophosphoesterase family protein [Liquorilactobacillus mali]EJF00520.1 putative calcineurin-like phosphoesterase [Liquorilactobacillus mali KCTC 3596 = DSM 20444]KRN09727.1 phosphohydrolase, Icc family protein [Liquorilactobacillus mali KCTC 3596 = DSM 20444]QFQ74017.1 metallophosphoesterase family protein [Liquorilactobacillus mali]
MNLEITGNKNFRICQLTDIHLGEYPFNDASNKTIRQIEQLLKENDFDLIMITGDLIWGKSVDKPDKVLGELYKMLNKYNVPVAVTYGNHDSEGQHSRAELRECEQFLEHRVPKKHSMVVNGRESYTLEVYRDNKLSNVLYVWDSGDYLKEEPEDYAAIEPEQVEWFWHLPYEKGKNKQDVAFMHIPLPEYNLVDSYQEGKKNESICASPYNSGLFYSLKKAKNIKALFVGHDHDNNFIADYKGIKLGYGNVTGYNTYGSLKRGARIIELTPTVVKTQIITFAEK